MPSSGSTACISGSITNCSTYTSATSNTYTAACSNCSAGYALISGVCTAVPIITTTVPTNVKCNVDEVPMMISTFCKTNGIPYCSTYVDTSSGTCSSCVDGYRLDRDTSNAIKSPNVCVAIASTTNCLTWNETNNICSKCVANYILY